MARSLCLITTLKMCSEGSIVRRILILIVLYKREAEMFLSVFSAHNALALPDLYETRRAKRSIGWISSSLLLRPLGPVSWPSTRTNASSRPTFK